MRLLHVIHSIDPAGGGPIEGIRQFSCIYKGSSIAMEVASLDAPDNDHLRDFPSPVHCLGPATLGTYGYSSKFLPWLREHRAEYDCVIINGLWQYHSFACWQALRGTSTPYAVFTHGMLAPYFKKRYPLKHLKKWLYWPWADYRVLRDAKAVLFTCEEEKVLAAQSFWLYKANSIVVGHGTQIPDFDLESARKAFLEEYPAIRGKRVAIFIGRIHPKKGCDLLIRAFAETLAHDPNWHLIMMGPDQVGWQSSLIKLSSELAISDRITWTGMIKGISKWGAIAASEIFILPSHQENFGVVVAEAMACGKPVLISNKVNIWREVQNERAGLIANDTLEGTVDLFRTWSEMPEGERRAMTERSLLCFQKHFDLASTSALIIELIETWSPANSSAHSYGAEDFPA